MTACLADSIANLEVEIPKARCNSEDECLPSCLVGDRSACLEVAYAVQSKDLKKPDSDRYFEKACALGSAVGCTNYAAAIWVRTHTAQSLECARRLFEKSCAAKENFACGMVGRLLAEAGDAKSAEAQLEKSCDELGGFPCRALAYVLEERGAETAATRLKALMARACKGGDTAACGEHGSASESFQH